MARVQSEEKGHIRILTKIIRNYRLNSPEGPFDSSKFAGSYSETPGVYVRGKEVVKGGMLDAPATISSFTKIGKSRGSMPNYTPPCQQPYCGSIEKLQGAYKRARTSCMEKEA